MDFWTIILIVAGFSGIMGWFFTIPLINCMLMYCNWREGIEFDWASEIGFAIAGPLAWFFAFFEIIVLYCK